MASEAAKPVEAEWETASKAAVEAAAAAAIAPPPPPTSRSRSPFSGARPPSPSPGLRAAPGEDEVGGPGHALHRLRRVGTRRAERGDTADGALDPPDRRDVVPGLRRGDGGRGRQGRGGQRPRVQRGAARRQQVHLPHQATRHSMILPCSEGPSQARVHARQSHENNSEVRTGGLMEVLGAGASWLVRDLPFSHGVA